MGYTGAATEEALLAKINGLLAKINTKVVALERSVDHALKWLPGFLGDKVVAGWNKFVGFLKDCWDYLADIFTNMGSPGTLWDTANTWSNNVGGPVSGKVQVAEAGSLTVDENWTGEAAERYKQNLPLQKAALSQIKSTFADGVSTALSSVATGIIVFWVLLGTALITLVAGIIAAIASTATVVGAPAGPFIAAAAVLATIGQVVGGGMILNGVASSANVTLRQKINDNTGYLDGVGHTGGSWPSAATG